jgi:hypothetical protein
VCSQAINFQATTPIFARREFLDFYLWRHSQVLEHTTPTKKRNCFFKFIRPCIVTNPYNKTNYRRLISQIQIWEINASISFYYKERNRTSPVHVNACQSIRDRTGTLERVRVHKDSFMSALNQMEILNIFCECYFLNNKTWTVIIFRMYCKYIMSPANKILLS